MISVQQSDELGVAIQKSIDSQRDVPVVKIDSMHVSLTKTAYLRTHEIELFIEMARAKFKSVRRFVMCGMLCVPDGRSALCLS